jgi:hypothetical protein
MSLDIQFAYVCQKKFADLPGSSEAQRHCADCNLDVVNLDPLDERARLALFEAAAQTGQRLCVSVTVPLVNNRSCRTLPPPPIATAGMPKMPPPEELRRERVRIEQENKGGLLKWLQSKF